jgi:hypothetical protein
MITVSIRTIRKIPMRLVRIAAASAAVVMAAAATIGIVRVGPASAAYEYGPLCVATDDFICAVGNGSSAVHMWPDPAATNWYESYEWNSPTELQQANTSQCMQVDHDAGNIVIEATCTGASYQTWKIGYNSNFGGYTFTSEWDPAECLTYNADGSDLVIGGCGNDWYQAFTDTEGQLSGPGG